MIHIDAKNFVDNNTQRPKNQNGNNQITEESCCAIFWKISKKYYNIYKYKLYIVND